MKFFNTILLPSLLGIVLWIALGLALLMVCRTWVEVSDAPSRTLEKKYEIFLRENQRLKDFLRSQKGGGTIGIDNYEG